jgi:hypothetical protein
MDMTGLLPEGTTADVLNGIAPIRQLATSS